METQLDLDVLPDMTKEQKQVEKTNRKIIEGKVMLRMVGYIETGKHLTSYQGVESNKDKVEILFEVFGKNYPVENGQPMRVKVEENYSLHDKANFKKLFMMMRNNDETIKHMSQMLGKAFIANLYNSNGYAKLKTKDDGYNVTPALIEDPETGEVRKINVPEAIGPMRRFIWAIPSKKDWDSLFIDGTYKDGNSKNVFQNKIKDAKNYKDSYIQILIEGEEKVEEKVTKYFSPNNSGEQHTDQFYLGDNDDTIDF